MNDGERFHLKKNIPTLTLEKLEIICALGRGAKGVVFLVRDSGISELLALKTISKASIKKKKVCEEYRRVCFELEVLSLFQHPLLPKLRGVLSTEKIVGYAIDYCPGGDLNSLRKNQTEKMFSDDIIRFYAAELVLALEYLHGLGIVYRDLKPDNIMIQDNGHLMLVDYDLSTKLSAKTADSRKVMNSITKPDQIKSKSRKSSPFSWCNSGISQTEPVHPSELGDNSSGSNSPEPKSVEKSNSFVGTEEYIAPEIIKGNGHDFSVDWWCLGVVLYEMLYGTTPFRGSNRKETFYRVLSKTPELVGEPTALRDLIRRLLEKDPTARISCEEIKGHDFFKGIDWNQIVNIKRPPYIPGRAEQEDGINVNNGIDVERFVERIFDVEEVEGHNRPNNKSENNTDNFLIF